MELINERKLFNEKEVINYLKIYQKISSKLNALINSSYKNKAKS